MTSRREVLASLGAAWAATIPVGGGTARAASLPQTLVRGAEADVPADLLVRMRCAPGGAWAMWVYSGTLVVKPASGVARTLMRIEGCSFNRATPRGPGEWDYVLDEVGYYCDLETGRPLDLWTNPLTGREVRAVHYRSPQRFRFDRSTVTPAMDLPPGIEFRGEITPPATVAGLVVVTEDLYVKLPARPATADRAATRERAQASLATHVSRAEDLARPSADWLDAMLSYGTMNAPMSWLGIDDPGVVQNMRLIGRKVRADALDVLPPWLLERARRDHPTFFDVPKG
jgi:hypothetical protein